MPLRRTSTLSNRVKRGFALIELLVVLGIFALLVSLGLPISWRSYQIYSFQTEYARVARFLMVARSRSMANLSQHSYRVCYDSVTHQLRLVPRACHLPDVSETADLSKQIRISQWPTWGIGFTQLSGASNDSTVIVADDEHSELLVVNDHGAIDW